MRRRLLVSRTFKSRIMRRRIEKMGGFTLY
jgi:hypothetical protein